MLSEAEISYLRSQRLARLATAAPDGQPTVDAVGFQFDGERFLIGGHNLPASHKYRNVAAGNRQVALRVDDLAATDPWTPRGIKMHGVAAIEARDGMFGPGDYFVNTPTVAWSWGVVAPAFARRRVAQDGLARHLTQAGASQRRRTTMTERLSPGPEQLLGEPAFCQIATLLPDGAPHLAQVWANTDGEHILINTFEGAQKLRNLRRDPQVAVNVVDPGNAWRLASMRGRVVDIATEGADDHFDDLTRKYLGVERYLFRQPGQVRVNVTIAPERIHEIGLDEPRP